MLAAMSKVRVTRKAYYRKPVTRSDGVYVRGGFVRSASFLVEVKDRPVKKAKASRSVKVKKAPLLVSAKSAILSPDYPALPESKRRAILKAAVRLHGYQQTIVMLRAASHAARDARTSRTIIGSDVDWMERGRARALARRKSLRSGAA